MEVENEPKRIIYYFKRYFKLAWTKSNIFNVVYDMEYTRKVGQI